MQAARGIQNHHINVLAARRFDGAVGDVDRVLVRGAGEKLDTHFTRQGFQLTNGRRAVDIGTDHQHGFLVPLFKEARQLGHGGGFTSTLQTRHHNDGRRPGRQVKGLVALAHHPLQLLLDDFHKYLARRQAALHFLADGPLAHAFDKRLDHRQRNVCLQQGHAHFTQGFLDIVFGKARLTRDLAQAAG